MASTHSKTMIPRPQTWKFEEEKAPSITLNTATHWRTQKELSLKTDEFERDEEASPLISPVKK